MKLALPCDKLGNGDFPVDCGGCSTEGMEEEEEIGGCDKGLDVVVFNTCVTVDVASSIDEKCVVIGEDVCEDGLLILQPPLLLKLSITSSPSPSPLPSLSSASFIVVDNGEFDGEEEEEEKPLLERSRGCWDEELELLPLLVFCLPTSMLFLLLLLSAVSDELRGCCRWLWRADGGCGESSVFVG